MIPRWAELLLLLQRVDLRIRDLRKRLAMLPAERKKLQDHLTMLAKSKEDAQKELKTAELDIKQAESEIEANQAKIMKLQQQSAMIKKNNEYQSMLSEIGSVKMKISDLESFVLEKFDLVEELKTKLRETLQDCDAQMRSGTAELKELDEFEKELKNDIVSGEAERKGLGAGVDPSLLSRYEQILKRGQGSPLALVENGICKNCNLRLTPQTMNSIKSGKIASCDNCMHIVYGTQND